jgi:hypothetical protein
MRDLRHHIAHIFNAIVLFFAMYSYLEFTEAMCAEKRYNTHRDVLAAGRQEQQVDLGRWMYTTMGKVLHESCDLLENLPENQAEVQYR